MLTAKRYPGNGVEVKPYTLRELADIYGYSPKIMRKHLKPLLAEVGKRAGWYYQIPQVEIIFKHLSVPYIINKNEAH